MGHCYLQQLELNSRLNDIQKEEAGYRKELVHGEDDPIRAAPPTIGQLYNRVRATTNPIFIIYILTLSNGVIFKEW